MKKLLCIPLLLVYVALSAGVTIQYNYCKGHLTKVDLYIASGCPVCKEKADGCCCCTTETELVQLDTDSVQPALSNFDLAGKQILLPLYHIAAIDLAVGAGCVAKHDFAPPPDYHSPPLFILDGNLRI